MQSKDYKGLYVPPKKSTVMIARQIFSSVMEAVNESSDNETWTDDGEEVVLIPGADEYGSNSDEEDS